MRFLFTLILFLSVLSVKSQYINAERVRITQNFRPPLDTSINPQYLYEWRWRDADSSIYIARSITGKKWWKMVTGGGSSTYYSLNALRRLGNTLTGTVDHDTTMTGNPLEILWNKYEPIEKIDTGNTPFYQWQFAGTNNGRYNEVMMWGWNINSGGGSLISGIPAVGEAWESNYEIDPSGVGHRYVEKHEFYVDRFSTQHRLSSFTIDADLNTISLYHTTDNFDLHNSVTHTPYFSIFNSTHLSNMSLVLQNDQSKYFNIAGEFAESPTANAFSISAPGDKASRSFKLLNFNYARIPSSVAVFDEHNSSSVISLQDSGGTNLSQWKGTPTNAEINTPSSSGKYIAIAPEQVNAVNFYSTNSAFLQPVYIGSGTYSGSNKAVIDNGDKVTSLRVNNFDGSGGNHYGTTSIVSGGGSNTNIGAYLWGFNGSSNYNVQFGPLGKGASNYTMYGSGDAVSHLAGWMSIGPNPAEYPSATLEVYGTAKIDTLATGSSTDSYVVQNNGVLKTIAAPLSGSSTLDFANTSAQNSSDLTISVSGAADGDVVSLGVPNAAVNTNTCYTAWVSASDTVTVRFNNYSSGSVNPASGTFKVKILK